MSFSPVMPAGRRAQVRRDLAVGLLALRTSSSARPFYLSAGDAQDGGKEMSNLCLGIILQLRLSAYIRPVLVDTDQITLRIVHH